MGKVMEFLAKETNGKRMFLETQLEHFMIYNWVLLIMMMKLIRLPE